MHQVETTPAHRSWIITAAAWALSAAAVDVAVSLLNAPPDSAAGSDVARLLLADALMLAPLFAIAAGMAAIWPARWLVAPRIWIAAVGASAAGALLIFGSPYNRLISYFRCRPDLLICRPNAVSFFPLVFGAAVMAALFGGAAFDREDTRHARSTAAVTTAPGVAIALVIAIWLPSYGTAESVAAAIATMLILTSVLASRLALRFNRSGILLGGLILALVTCAWPSQAVRAGTEAERSGKADRNLDDAAPTILLISVDALRADALSPYGQPGNPTPHIDRFARDGVVFESAISPAPWTLPALASVMTGLDPATHNVGVDTSLPANVPTLAERLAERGYQTHALVTNWLVTRDSGLARGFDDYRLMVRPPPTEASNGSFAARVWRKLTDSQPYTGDNDKISAESVTAAAIDIMRTRRGRPQFLWLHYFDTHQPYAPPRPFVPPGVPIDQARFVGDAHSLPATPQMAGRIRSLYDAEVRYVDASIGVLFEAMRSLGLYERATIVLTADHGEAFWEHGHGAHGVDLYQETVHVPLIVKTSGLAARREPVAVSTQSIMSTLFDVASVTYAAGDIQSPPLPLTRAAPGGSSLFVPASTNLKTFVEQVSIVSQGFKYISSPATGREELYDLVRDPLEQTSLVNAAPAALALARAQLAARMAEARRLGDRYGVRKTPRGDAAEASEKLKALGYIR
jgi:arylsulfatase A-like enzyme